MKNVLISSADHGKTVLSYLKGKFPFAFVHKIFRKNGLRVNGIRAKEGMVLKKGDELRFYIPVSDKPPKPSEARSEQPRGFNILLEHADFLIVNKKPGIAVHEGKTVSFRESLQGQLKTFLKEKNLEPFLVHRLDTNTSGCLIVAKNETAQKAFEQMFQEGKIQKEYSVLVSGLLKNRTGSMTYRLEGREGNAVNALTTYEVEQEFRHERFSLIRARIMTGRKHQIRIHFAKLGHPVVMDPIYGDFDLNKNFRKQYGLKRQFLHARSLRFVWHGEEINVGAALSADLAKTLRSLSGKRA